MILNPECQAKAQEEIDAVIGPGRLPEFNDRPSLPYLEHLSQETLRFAPLVNIMQFRSSPPLDGCKLLRLVRKFVLVRASSYS